MGALLRAMTRDPDLATPRQRRVGAFLLLALLTSPAWLTAIAAATGG